MTDDLVTWLRAQVDEDEASEWPHRPKCPFLIPVPDGFPFPKFTCNCDAADRWLREIETKRRIIDLHVEDHECPVDASRAWSSSVYYTRGKTCLVLRLLALPFVARPGYREEWRPDV